MIKEKASKEIEEWIEYRQRALDDMKEYKPGLLSLAETLDRLEVRDDDVNLSYNSIRITLNTIEEARSLVGKILKNTDIKEFSKNWEAQGDKIIWGYSLNMGDISLRIIPCEPNQECIPTQRVSTYTTWICERK